LNDPSIWRPGAILRFFPDKNVKISWNRVHIQIQQPKVSIKRYIILHIEKVCFQPKKWLSVKIWPLKIFFSSKSIFFRELSDLEQKIKKNFLAFFENFLSQNLVQKGQKIFQNRSKSTFFTLFSRIEWFGTKDEKKFF
jgi:hypothetical protein